MAKRIIKTYSELIRLSTFEDRFNYLKIGQGVGEETFGFERYLNQVFYTSPEWRKFRRDIIIRDNGCDLGISDREIGKFITIHHINEIAIDDIRDKNLESLLNPENVICASSLTHKAIHYGDEKLLVKAPIERSKNDTCPWRR